MMQVRVRFDDDAYDVAAIEDPFSAERFDLNATLASAERQRDARRPLDDPLDWDKVKLSFQRLPHAAEVATKAENERVANPPGDQPKREPSPQK